MRSFAPPTTAARSHVEMTPRGVRAPVVTFIALLVMCVAFMVAMSPAVANAAPTPAELYPDDYPAELRDAPQGSIINQFGPNRECTSYVAWRLHRDGVRFANPNGALSEVLRADDAGPAMAALGGRVDNIPEVGAIIQWKPNEYIYSPDSISDSKRWSIALGSIGHVAYIEAINPDGSVLVSQYNAGEPKGTWSADNVYLWTGRVLHFPNDRPLGTPPPTAPPIPVVDPPADETPSNGPAPEPPPTQDDGITVPPPPERVCTRVPMSRDSHSTSRRFALTSAQMRTNQRIAIAAIGRAREWDRIARGKSIAAKKSAKARPKSGKVRLTLSQLRTNHRIGLEALELAYHAERKLIGNARRPRLLDMSRPTVINTRTLRDNQRLSQEALRRVMSIRCTFTS